MLILYATVGNFSQFYTFSDVYGSILSVVATLKISFVFADFICGRT
jgi:hypothetical protein